MIENMGFYAKNKLFGVIIISKELKKTLKNYIN